MIVELGRVDPDHLGVHDVVVVITEVMLVVIVGIDLGRVLGLGLVEVVVGFGLVAGLEILHAGHPCRWHLAERGHDSENANPSR